MDEDQFAGRAEDEGRACDSDDPFGENVRKEQDGNHSNRAGLVELLCLYILVVGILVHSSQSAQKRHALAPQPDQNRCLYQCIHLNGSICVYDTGFFFLAPYMVFVL